MENGILRVESKEVGTVIFARFQGLDRAGDVIPSDQGSLNFPKVVCIVGSHWKADRVSQEVVGCEEREER